MCKLGIADVSCHYAQTTIRSDGGLAIVEMKKVLWIWLKLLFYYVNKSLAFNTFISSPKVNKEYHLFSHQLEINHLSLFGDNKIHLLNLESHLQITFFF